MPTKAMEDRISVPEGVSGRAEDAAKQQAHQATVLSLWDAGEISTRQAAAEFGLQYHEFLDLLTAKGIPVERGTFDAQAVEDAARHITAGKA